jgi:hypothetical protein
VKYQVRVRPTAEDDLAAIYGGFVDVTRVFYAGRDYEAILRRGASE